MAKTATSSPKNADLGVNSLLPPLTRCSLANDRAQTAGDGEEQE